VQRLRGEGLSARALWPSTGRCVLAAAIMLPALAAAGGTTRHDGEDAVAGASAAAERQCVPTAQWVRPRADGAAPVAAQAIVDQSLAADVVLLGETHDSAEHHRWQLQLLIALHARRPDMVIALEMFPRRVQPALDRWVAGELDEAAFLEASDWRAVWSFNPSLYLPIFHFARMNRVPLLAVNVDRALTRAVAERGLASLPENEREGISDPAPALAGYVDLLFDSWLEHLPLKPGDASPERDSDDFRRFVETQLVWDRAMAEGIAAARERQPGVLVVGLMGSGHVVHGWGVAHQLAALGLPGAVSLLPWDSGSDCARLVAGYADAVFGVEAPPRPPAAPRVRLGVTLEPVPAGVRIASIAADSVAASARLRVGDVIVELGGAPISTPGQVAQAVARQPPGSWLPVKVQRGRRLLERVARFPPQD
jgi:uncharacterized iron-regulated protein